jgi:hypothetical protein
MNEVRDRNLLELAWYRLRVYRDKWKFSSLHWIFKQKSRTSSCEREIKEWEREASYTIIEVQATERKIASSDMESLKSCRMKQVLGL